MSWRTSPSGDSQSSDRPRPLYARVLRLERLQLGSAASFFLFEGMIALAVVLSLAELVSWWSVILLPLTVAVAVKINDAVASLFGRSKDGRRRSRVRGVAKVPYASSSGSRRPALRRRQEDQPARRLIEERSLASTGPTHSER
jgi:hypothetical protein